MCALPRNTYHPGRSAETIEWNCVSENVHGKSETKRKCICSVCWWRMSNGERTVIFSSQTNHSASLWDRHGCFMLLILVGLDSLQLQNELFLKFYLDRGNFVAVTIVTRNGVKQSCCSHDRSRKYRVVWFFWSTKTMDASILYQHCCCWWWPSLPSQDIFLIFMQPNAFHRVQLTYFSTAISFSYNKRL